jgi:hypothetical protein
LCNYSKLGSMGRYTGGIQINHGDLLGTAWKVSPGTLIVTDDVGQRRNKLFSPGSLPFNDFEDVREAFHASVRGRINTASLERAIHLSNLATFLWVILQPDEAHTLLGGREQRSNASTRSNRRLGSLAAEEGNPDIRDTVSRRNRVFGMAWKRYWKDVIPQNMRGNRHAIQLWARLSVQVSCCLLKKKAIRLMVDHDDIPLEFCRWKAKRC